MFSWEPVDAGPARLQMYVVITPQRRVIPESLSVEDTVDGKSSETRGLARPRVIVALHHSLATTKRTVVLARYP